MNAVSEPFIGEATTRFDPWATLQGLRRRLPLIGAIAVTTTALAIGYVAVTPAKYTATTQVLIDTRGLRILDNDIANRATTGDNDLIAMESQRQVIESRSVLEKVIDRAGLENDPLFGARPAGLRSQVMSIFGSGEREDRFSKALKALQKSLTVRRGDRSFVIDIGVVTEDPQTSQHVANTVAEVYIGEEQRARAEAVGRANAALAARLSELRERVTVAEGKVEAYKKDHRIIGIDGGRADEQDLRGLNTQLLAAQAQVAELQSRVDQIKSIQNNRAIDALVLPETLQASSITALKEQYAALMRQQAELGQSLLPQHPQMKAIAAQAEQIRQLMRAEIGRVATATSANLERAKATVADLEKRAAALKNNVLSTNETSVQLRELEREADSSRTVYASYLQRSKELSEQQGVDTSNTRVISDAVLPRDRSGASPILIIAAGLLLGAGLGTTLAWGLDQIDDRLREANQAAAASGLPVLASVPGAWRHAPASQFNFPAAIRSGRSNLKTIDRLTVTKPFLLGQLAFSLESMLPPSEARTVVIVSPDASGLAGDMRSKIVVDLAVTFTQDGERTLLVDGDSRGRQLSQRVLATEAASGENVITPLPAGASLRILPMGATATGQMARSQRALLDDISAAGTDAPSLTLIDAARPQDDLTVQRFIASADMVLVLVDQGATRQRALNETLASIRALRPRSVGMVFVEA
ncbi:exopolysaccharide transport family protein [Chelatococcus sp.]|nr:exopolysaccharide transport family protein [Chelatococcus sp.]